MNQSIQGHPANKLQGRTQIYASHTQDSYAHSMLSVVTNICTHLQMSFVLYLICHPSLSDFELALYSHFADEKIVSLEIYFKSPIVGIPSILLIRE